MDKGYVDYTRLYHIKDLCDFFVTRLKDNTQYRVVKSQKTDKTTGILCDQILCLTGTYSAINYPEPLRRVKYRDAETSDMYEFLTNN